MKRLLLLLLLLVPIAQAMPISEETIKQLTREQIIEFMQNSFQVEGYETTPELIYVYYSVFSIIEDGEGGYLVERVPLFGYFDTSDGINCMNSQYYTDTECHAILINNLQPTETPIGIIYSTKLQAIQQAYGKLEQILELKRQLIARDSGQLEDLMGAGTIQIPEIE